jgi:hypothetical protein
MGAASICILTGSVKTYEGLLMYVEAAILNYNSYFEKYEIHTLSIENIRIFRSAIDKAVHRAALNAAGVGNYFCGLLEDGYSKVCRFKSNSAFETFVTELSEQALGDLITPLSMSQADVLPFAFTHVVPTAEMKRRAERLEVQAGFLPWLDWTDFLDDAETELLEELRDYPKRLNMREHQIEEDRTFETSGMRIICSFANETDMVVFRAVI